MTIQNTIRKISKVKHQEGPFHKKGTGNVYFIDEEYSCQTRIGFAYEQLPIMPMKDINSKNPKENSYRIEEFWKRRDTYLPQDAKVITGTSKEGLIKKLTEITEQKKQKIIQEQKKSNKYNKKMEDKYPERCWNIQTLIVKGGEE